MSSFAPDDPETPRPAYNGDDSPVVTGYVTNAADPIETIGCWRCGKEYSIDRPACPFCRAENRASERPSESRADSADLHSTAVGRALAAFCGLMIVSLIVGLSLHLQTDVPQPAELLTWIAVQTVVDAIIVLAALMWVPRPGRVAMPGRQTRQIAWALSPVLLVAVLALNFGYHWLLRSYGVPWLEDELMQDRTLLPWLVLLVCVAPAAFEELFFRRIAFDALGRVTGPHATVLITSVMFGIAHVGAPLSIPVLMLLGVGLGYARLYSGGLALPVALHFCHNAVILALEQLR